MSQSISKLRYSAFVAQAGLCYYCGRPMWADEPEQFARMYGLTPAQAAQRRCTAEHLQAQCDGGLNCHSNIAAACHYCNQRRHRRLHPLEPAKYQLHVLRRCAAGRWSS